MDVENYLRLGLDQPFDIGNEVNGRSNMELIQALAVPQDAQYNPCTEAWPDPAITSGVVQVFDDWSGSTCFPQTFRSVALYRPNDSHVAGKLPLMVFNDGLAYADPNGPVRACQVLDTLIHKHDIPPMAAVFVMPGRARSGQGQVAPDQADPADMQQRSVEYDSLTPLYGEFLLNELLPFAEQQLACEFSNAPEQRAICGISSGGICAFNTAWHHPHAFGRVISHCGSFVNIRGGHNYPYLVRSTPRKPIKVYLTSGRHDGNIILGNWPLANQQMASALEYAGYDYHFEFGEGGHSLRHGGALFAQSLRWLWTSE